MNTCSESSIESDWRNLETAPKDCTWFEGLTKANEIVKVHYACDLSGEEQPAFEGFFKNCGSYFAEVDIIKWRPLIINNHDIKN